MTTSYEVVGGTTQRAQACAINTSDTYSGLLHGEILHRIFSFIASQAHIFPESLWIPLAMDDHLFNQLG